LEVEKLKAKIAWLSGMLTGESHIVLTVFLRI
jgi:hypothetical protein